MPDWSDVEAKLAAIHGREQKQQDEAAERERAQAAFEQWCVRAQRDVMGRLRLLAIVRARRLAERTGAAIQVQIEPAGSHRVTRSPPIVLSLRGVVVYLYATRAAGGSPFIHLAHRRAGRARNPVVVSTPGCALMRCSDGGTELRDASQPDRPAMSADALVLRAFDHLVAARGSITEPLEARCQGAR